MAKSYVCKICGYVHKGDSLPEVCPVCKQPASSFEAVKPKGFLSDKNSNAYILTYSTVMVVVVALALAFVALSLKDLQQANILNEKKQAILVSLGAAEENYDDFVEAYAVDSKGQKVAGVDGKAVIDMLSDLTATFASGQLPVFEAKDGRVVLPVTGTGLWGPVWGYVALQGDMSTISGIVMDHASETPGLGAEIATAKHQDQYIGKSIFEGDKFVSITLVKGGVKAGSPSAAHEVDGITGGTKTGDGVNAMFSESLGMYVPFFNAKRAASAPAKSTECCNNVNEKSDE
ncbi:MAG: Na(+)-translocating NADH:ubiquinone reductase subunit C [Rikenellaceae bacterium]